MSRVLENAINQVTKKFNAITHKGIDLVKSKSQTCHVIAHSDGVVVWIQTGQKNNTKASGNASYGNCIKIKHDNGYYTLYAHLQDVKVKVGERVSKGKVIGYMGNTGRSFGAHLHFEVRNEKDVRINPTNFIDSDLHNNEMNIVKEWQKAMNKSYNCHLKEDGRFGPDSQSKAKKYQVYLKIPQIHNEYVLFLQKQLNKLGYNLKEDGYFGASTNNAIKLFQKSKGLKVDGFVGLDTISKILKG